MANKPYERAVHSKQLFFAFSHNAHERRKERGCFNQSLYQINMKLSFERTGAFTYITINRPEKRNAIDHDTIELFDELLDEIEHSKKDRALVISGAGDEAFCSGGDLSVFHALRTRDEAYDMLSKMSRVLYKIFTLEIPTIALINGTAVGGGAELAAACDYRIAANHAKIGFVQGKLAITTGWGGATYLLEKMPAETAFHMLTTTSIYTAKEAEELGYVQHVLDGKATRESLEQYFSPWENVSSDVLRAYKKRKLDAIDLSRLKSRVHQEVTECAVLWESEEHHQAVDAFRNKNK